jgi:hypothetical protein
MDSGDAPVWILLAFPGRLRGLASGKDDGRRKQEKNSVLHDQNPSVPRGNLDEAFRRSTGAAWLV